MTESDTHTGDRPEKVHEASAAHELAADDNAGAKSSDPEPSVPPAFSTGLAALPVGSQKLDPNWIKVNRISHWILTGVLSVIAIVYLALQWTLIGMALPWALATTGLAIVLIAGLVYRAHVYPAIWYRKANYEIREAAIEIRTGVLFKNIMTVPRSRVQHTDVAQGPLMRRYGIASLAIHTAGTQHAKVELPGLAKERAEFIRDHLIARVAEGNGVVPMQPALTENISDPADIQHSVKTQEANGDT